jgi:hypothetical protein
MSGNNWVNNVRRRNSPKNKILKRKIIESKGIKQERGSAKSGYEKGREHVSVGSNVKRSSQRKVEYKVHFCKYKHVGSDSDNVKSGLDDYSMYKEEIAETSGEIRGLFLKDSPDTAFYNRQ